MIETLGQSPINSALTAGRSEFMSIFRRKVSDYSENSPNRYPRAYSLVRGILINKDFLGDKPIDLSKGYYFQYNPQTINDVKSTLYEVRSYAGLPYNDYIWGGGGERIISFSLFLDNTRYSQQPHINGEPFSETRLNKRGILPEVEKLQSFLYPAPLAGESTPLFSEGGIVTSTQFRPPAIVVLALGPLYLEGVIKSAPANYTLFDQDLTPIRGTVEIEFAVFEFENVVRQIDWKPV